jgi:hypothetical protein
MSGPDTLWACREAQGSHLGDLRFRLCDAHTIHLPRRSARAISKFIW